MTPVPTFDEVAEVVRRHTAVSGPITPATALQEHGVYGDDIHDLLEAYSERFGVNMDGYRWQYHTGPEGCNPFWLLIRSRYPEIPITVGLLHQFAETGRWAIDYPPVPPRTPLHFGPWGWVTVVVLLTVFAFVVWVNLAARAPH